MLNFILPLVGIEAFTIKKIAGKPILPGKALKLQIRALEHYCKYPVPVYSCNVHLKTGGQNLKAKTDTI
jgi:hypothetical protein